MAQQPGLRSLCVLAAPFAATSNTVLANVTGMTVPIAAKQKMAIQFTLPFTLAGTASGFKFEVTAPAAPANFLENYFVVADDATITIENTITAPASVGNTLANAGNHVIKMYVYIENGSTAGNVALQWAQNVSDSGAATLNQGCIMDIIELS